MSAVWKLFRKELKEQCEVEKPVSTVKKKKKSI